MPTRKFIFRAQPALDKAIAKQKECEQALVDARKALEQEREKLKTLMAQLDEIRKSFRTRHENLVSPDRSTSDPRDLARAAQDLQALKRREEKQIGLIDEQKKQIAWASDMVELRKKELNEAMAGVQALEKLKEKRKKEHELAIAKAEEGRRDDDAIQLWNAHRNE